MRIHMKDISIEFPGVKALKSVNFSVTSGTTHALIGANGAGKSTLMKALSGAYSHYTGEILFDDVPVTIRSPKQSKDLGIQIVYQEVDTALIPYLTVSENIMLDRLHEQGWINWSKLHKQAKEILDRLNLKIPPQKLASELTLAQKQMVLIARAISRSCKFLILDEPTAPLSQTETDELFRIVRELKANDVGVIFISHRLPELFEICEEITIMRDGMFVAHEDIKNIDVHQVVELMLGQRMEEQFPKPAVEIGKVSLEVSRLQDHDLIQDVTFRVHKGEIIGLAGLVGAGKTEVCKALFGVASGLKGSKKLYGKELHIRNPHDAVLQGLALVPEERRKEGILVEETVTTNMSVVSLKNFLKIRTFINFKEERKVAKELIQKLGIKTPNEMAKVRNLSGGNQQKIAIGKWLISEAEVYIFDEPTKGVDVGAKKDIFELIFELASRGKSIIYASCEFSEILGITDRTYVLYDGKTVKELVTKETNEEEILFYSTGGQ